MLKLVVKLFPPLICLGINAVEVNVSDQYPVLFNGLGTFKGEYIINLKSNAQPFSLLHQEMCQFH